MSVEGSVLRAAEPSTNSLKNTPTATCFEQFNLSSEEFVSMVRFEQRKRVEEFQ